MHKRNEGVLFFGKAFLYNRKKQAGIDRVFEQAAAFELVKLGLPTFSGRRDLAGMLYKFFILCLTFFNIAVKIRICIKCIQKGYERNKYTLARITESCRSMRGAKRTRAGIHSRAA